MKYKLVLDMNQEGIDRYIVHLDHPQAVFRLHDKTNVPEPELMKFKSKAVNYATTEPNGRYFMLTIEMVEPHDYISEEKLAENISNILIGAADYVHKMFSQFMSN